MASDDRPAYVRCPSCGRTNPGTRVLCEKCGASLAGIASGRYDEVSRASRSSRGPAWPSEAPRSSRAYATDGDRSGPVWARSADAVDRRSSRRRGRAREPRKGLIALGAVISILAVLLLAVSLASALATQTKKVDAGSAWTIDPQTLNSVTAQLTWVGGTAKTHVYLVTGTPTCTTPTGEVGKGSGPDGSLSASLTPGTSYNLYACAGTSPQTLTFNLNLTGGVTWGEITGIVLLVFGLPLLAIGIRGQDPRASEL